MQGRNAEDDAAVMWDERGQKHICTKATGLNIVWTEAPGQIEYSWPNLRKRVNLQNPQEAGSVAARLRLTQSLVVRVGIGCEVQNQCGIEGRWLGLFRKLFITARWIERR